MKNSTSVDPIDPMNGITLAVSRSSLRVRDTAVSISTHLMHTSVSPIRSGIHVHDFWTDVLRLDIPHLHERVRDRIPACWLLRDGDAQPVSFHSKYALVGISAAVLAHVNGDIVENVCLRRILT